MHGNDPPVPVFYGVPQVLYDFDTFDRLFTEVPSEHNGMTFCVGTRYESGQDVFEGIRRFGTKIFHVHFRNVHGRIPEQGWYEEGIPDEGDLNMFEVARALKEAGYEGRARLRSHHASDQRRGRAILHRLLRRAYAGGSCRRWMRWGEVRVQCSLRYAAFSRYPSIQRPAVVYSGQSSVLAVFGRSRLGQEPMAGSGDHCRGRACCEN